MPTLFALNVVLISALGTIITVRARIFLCPLALSDACYTNYVVFH